MVFVVYIFQLKWDLLAMTYSVSEPMLASRFNILSGVQLPLLASAKYDGIRCLIVEVEGKPAAVTRTMRPIPNLSARTWLEENCPIGFDGELVVRGEDFHGSSSALMSRNGKPDFLFALFDYINPKSPDPLGAPYTKRLTELDAVLVNLNLSGRVVRIPTHQIECITDLDPLMDEALASGHEGLVLRSPCGRYKIGRALPEEGLMMKLKPCEDAEAEIVGFESERNDLFMPDRLGSFSVRLLSDPTIRFNVGTGFTNKQRTELWNNRANLMGKFVRFRYQSQGMKSAPRFPVFEGIRDETDI
jgi:DNA ligase-1